MTPADSVRQAPDTRQKQVKVSDTVLSTLLLTNHLRAIEILTITQMPNMGPEHFDVHRKRNAISLYIRASSLPRSKWGFLSLTRTPQFSTLAGFMRIGSPTAEVKGVPFAAARYEQ